MEQGLIENSGRVTNRLLNSLLHRTTEIDSLKLRTMTDLVEHIGMDRIRYTDAWADSVLNRHGWDPETALPTSQAFLAPDILAADLLTRNGNTDQDKKTICKMIEEINKNRDPDAQIPDDSMKPFEINVNKNVVEISIDGVCAKRQKDSRDFGNEASFVHDKYDCPVEYSRPPEPKKRPSVETAVAHIEFKGETYIMIAQNMFQLGKNILAFLLDKNMLVENSLVFYSDGGTDIKGMIERIFSFCPHSVVLDWFHIRKHGNESFSMGLKGGKANRKMQYEVKRRFYHILYAGNIDSAKQYLNSLDESKIKNPHYIQSIINYLDRKEPSIACYAVRKKLGLRISSNKVEKANDLIVSTRQKGKGMSWSRFGSWGLASVTAMYLNNEQDIWHSQNHIPFNMYKSYGAVFDLQNCTAV